MKILIFAVLSLCLNACSTSLKNYENSKPNFDLETFFDGNLKAYGIVQNRQGDVLRRFKVDMVGTWNNGVGTLHESFKYDDGEEEIRIWTLTKTSENEYIGTAPDVSKDAIGKTSGYAFNWNYTLAIKVDDDIWHVDFNDWMYLLDDKRLINRAEMTKFGFRVGEVTLWIEKE